MPEAAPPAELPDRKLVSKISASSFVLGFSGLLYPQFLQTCVTDASSAAFK